MDNAGNCDTTAVELGVIIPSFGGAASRLRCILHILNLIAKVGICFLECALVKQVTGIYSVFFQRVEAQEGGQSFQRAHPESAEPDSGRAG